MTHLLRTKNLQSFRHFFMPQFQDDSPSLNMPQFTTTLTGSNNEEHSIPKGVEQSRIEGNYHLPYRIVSNLSYGQDYLLCFCERRL